MSKGKAVTPEGEEAVHLVTIDWARGKWSGTAGKYAREHVWHFAGRLSVKVSDAMSPAGYRDTARLDPLKSYVATIASAHMLAWLHAAFSHEVEVESYLDKTEGVLSALPDGRYWVSEVVLKPRIAFASNSQVDASVVAHFHELAQRDCFIAQSIKTKVTIRSA